VGDPRDFLRAVGCRHRAQVHEAAFCLRNQLGRDDQDVPRFESEAGRFETGEDQPGQVIARLNGGDAWQANQGQLHRR